MTPLQLAGRATAIRGFGGGAARSVVRLRPISNGPDDDHDAALIKDREDVATAISKGFRTACTIGSDVGGLLEAVFERSLVLPLDFDYLGHGDILGLHGESGRIRVLYRSVSHHNSFLVTERCNHYCLMCSQPPRNVNDGWIIDEIAEALPLVDPGTLSIGFTGGEPLLEWRRFVRLLELARVALPKTRVHVLTNGRAFASPAVTSAWASIGHPDLCAGIPVYAAVDHVHDFVVQARGAFDETLLGILRLKDKQQRVEVRVVLHRITAPRLLETCEWIARNLPFVDHVALMGLENTGFAIANETLLWIDPVDYRDDLSAGVALLSAGGMHVSVYNLPLCVLDRSVWPFAVQSISDWKNAYLPLCDPCRVRDRCAGFFSTGRMRESRGLEPVSPLS